MRIMVIILSLFVFIGTASAKYISLPKLNATIDNRTELATEDLKLTLNTYRVKPNHPPFGIGRPAPEIVDHREYNLKIDEEGNFSTPKINFWDGKRRYIGLNIETTSGEKIIVHTRLPEDGIEFSRWIPLMMKLSDSRYTISRNEYVSYYSNIELYYNVDGEIVAKSTAPFNDLDAYEGSTGYLQELE